MKRALLRLVPAGLPRVDPVFDWMRTLVGGLVRGRRVVVAGFGGAVVASLPALAAPSVTLTWSDNSDNEDGFVLQRQVSGGAYADLAVTKANVTRFADTEVQPGVSYRYRVAAFNRNGQSIYSRAAATTIDLENRIVAAPSVGALADRSTPVGQSAGALALVVSNGAGGDAGLSVTVSSSQPSVVANEGLVLQGTGADRTLTITPVAGRSGVTVITVVVSNGQFSSSSSFLLKVGATEALNPGDNPSVEQIYFGTTGTSAAGGRFGLVLRPDRTGLFVADGPEFPLGAAVVPFTCGAAGDFSFDVKGAGTIRGVVTRGTVSGVIGSVAVPFVGALDVSPAAGTARQGLYNGAVADTQGDLFLSLIGPSGKSLVAVSQGTFVRLYDAAFDQAGKWKGGSVQEAELDLSLQDQGGVISGLRKIGQQESVVGARLERRGSSERITNVSVRGALIESSDLLVTGFTVGGVGIRPIVVRAVGPTLAEFGVPGVLPDPLLEVFRQGSGDSLPFAVNDSWNEQVMPAAASYGGFPLLSQSADAAILASLPAGSYTARVGTGSSGSGQVLVELYDADTTGEYASARLSNISLLTRLGAIDGRIIGGFSIAGEIPRRLLLRAVGPELARFGVGGVLKDPVLELYRSGGALLTVVDHSPSDPATISLISTRTGAFGLDAGTKSSSQLVWLAPGSYTAHVKSGDGSPGVVLLEIYEVP
jgi:hypothetical protein